ncbi:metallophosphoesterase [Litchfieldella rifensis]|uniref:Metallophosphoesterase n=1 Tax=Litchfieldella rifensis TaxID=762643 RepID=A0ABV7LMX5_9GAMM
MRLRILSDLHLEHYDAEPELPEVPADVVVLAGDIHRQAEGLAWAAKRFQDTPVILVAGNHEFYRTRLTELRARMRGEAERLGIHFLDNDAVIIDGVRFLGTTLWTDFALYADDEGHDPLVTCELARRLMQDFHLIEHPQGEVFTPVACQTLHREARTWLDDELAKPHDGPTVVVSHHAPLRECIPSRYRGDPLSPAFASRLDDLMGPMDLWVHGHVHDPVDLRIEGTRVIANPAGYPDEFESPLFVPDLVVEV